MVYQTNQSRFDAADNQPDPNSMVEGGIHNYGGIGGNVNNIYGQSTAYIINAQSVVVPYERSEHTLTVVQHQPKLGSSQLVGRGFDLSRIAELQEKHHVLTLTGTPGIGKSTLAAMYSRGYELCCWRDFQENPNFDEFVQAAIELLGLDTNISNYQRPVDQANLLIGILKQKPQIRMLLVVDGYEQDVIADSATEGWAALFAATSLGNSRLLITSRRHINPRHILLKHIKVDGLDQSEGVALLYELEVEDAEYLLHEAVSRCEGHPLALVLLAGLVTVDGQTLTDLLAETTLWQGEVAKNLLDGIYQQLTEGERWLLKYISIFDPPGLFRQPIKPDDIAGLIAELPEQLQPTPVDDWQPAKIGELALNLTRRSLLIAENGEYIMHSVISDYFYIRLPESSTHHQVAATYFKNKYRAAHPRPVTHPATQLLDVQALLNAFEHLFLVRDYTPALILLNTRVLGYVGIDQGIRLDAILSRWGEYSRLVDIYERFIHVPSASLTDAQWASVFSKLSIFYTYLGRYKDVKDYATKAELAYDRADYIAGKCKHYLKLGRAYADLGQYEVAEICLEQARPIAEQLDDDEARAAVLGLLGSIRTYQGKYREAIDACEQAAALAKKINDERHQGIYMGYHGLALIYLSRYKKGMGYSERALKIAKRMGDRFSEEAQLGSIGIAYTYQAKYDVAIGHLLQADRIAEEIGDVRGRSRHLGNLGLAYAYLSDYQKAITYSEQALQIAERIGDEQSANLPLNNLSLVNSYMGNFTSAIIHAKRGLEIARRIGDQRTVGNHLGNLGIAYMYWGKYEQSLGSYMEALKIAQGIGDRRGEGFRLGNLSQIYAYLKDYPRAAEYAKQSLTIAERIQDLRMVGIAHANIGRAHTGLGDYVKAIGEYQQALGQAEIISDRYSLGSTLANLGRTYLKQNLPNEALDCFQRALDIAHQIGDRRGEVRRQGYLGRCHALMGDYQQARGYYLIALSQALEIDDRRGQGIQWQNLGDLYNKQGRPLDALICYYKALSIRIYLNNEKEEAQTQARVTALHSEMGEFEWSVQEVKACMIANDPYWRPMDIVDLSAFASG